MVNALFKSIGLLTLLLICCCFGSIAILLFKPDFIWDKVANNIADESLVIDFDGADIIEVSNRLNSQLTGVGENTIVISESDLNVLIKERSDNPNIFLDLKEDQARVLYKVDDYPLYAYAALHIEDNKINIDETGIGKIRLPNFVSLFVNDILKRFATELKIDSVLTQAGEGLILKGIEIDDSKLTIQVIFNPQIF